MKHFPKQERFLRASLGANAVFSGISGLILAAGHPYLSAWMGFQWPLVLMAVGLMLILFAADIIYLLHQPVLKRWSAAGIIGGDLLWVAASGVLLLGYPHLFNATGQAAVLGVALLVLLFAELQAFGLWKVAKKESTASA